MVGSREENDSPSQNRETSISMSHHLEGDSQVESSVTRSSLSRSPLRHHLRDQNACPSMLEERELKHRKLGSISPARSRPQSRSPRLRKNHSRSPYNRSLSNNRRLRDRSPYRRGKNTRPRRNYRENSRSPLRSVRRSRHDRSRSRSFSNYSFSESPEAKRPLKRDKYRSIDRWRSGSPEISARGDPRTYHRWSRERSTSPYRRSTGNIKKRTGRVSTAGGKRIKRESSSSESSNRSTSLKRSQKKTQSELELPLIQKQVEIAVSERVEEEVKKRVEEIINSSEFQKEIGTRLKVEKAKLEQSMRKELELEKARVLEAFKQQEIEKQLQSQKLEEILAANERKVQEEQKRLAAEQARRNEERLKELERIAQQKDEERRKRLTIQPPNINFTEKKAPKVAFRIGKNA